MLFTEIRDYVCNKVNKSDDNSKEKCLSFVKARHKMIYESFDWKAAQLQVEKTIDGGAGDTSTVDIPELHHCIDVLLDGKRLDPVTQNFIFDSITESGDDFNGAGTPKYYEEFYHLDSNVRYIRLYPALSDDGASHTLNILGKSPYNDTWEQSNLPNTESALIAFVLGDMWEFMHQVGKAQAKFQEGNALLKAAQDSDTPGYRRPRMSHIITPTGNSLIELAYSVCDILGMWTPEIINTVKNRLRRNWQTLWDLALWPESYVLASFPANGGVATLPQMMDRIIGVRINLNALQDSYQTLVYGDSVLYFGLKPEIFNQSGVPISYNLLQPSALPSDPPEGTVLQFAFSEDGDQCTVTVRGTVDGVSRSEEVTVTGTTAAQTKNAYDSVESIWKPVTNKDLLVQYTDGTTLMNLAGEEQGRKYQRIQLLPAFDSSDLTVDQTLFVLAKRTFPQLLKDGDTCQLIGAENVLINATTADMMLREGKADIAKTYSEAAKSALQILLDRETKQTTYTPVITPYVEPTAVSVDSDIAFLG